MAEAKILEIGLGDTINNITRLRAELKEAKKDFEGATDSKDRFAKGETVKELSSTIKRLTDATKENSNALGGINKSAQFAKGSLGELEQNISKSKDSLRALTVGTKEFDAEQAKLIQLQTQRIAIESKIPSLFQARIKGAIDESNALKELKFELKAAQAAALNGDGQAAKKVAELQDKIDDLKDSTKSLQGTAVERLNASVNLLTESFQNFDLDKAKTGFTALGTAMAAIPIFLLIEGVKLLVENFDEVLKFTKELTGSFSEEETTVKTLTKELDEQKKVTEQLSSATAREISTLEAKLNLAKAQGKSLSEQKKIEQEIYDQKLKLIAQQILEAETSYRLQQAKLKEIENNDSFLESLQRLTIQYKRLTGESAQADLIEKGIAAEKKERSKEVTEQLIKDQNAIADLKTSLVNLDIDEQTKKAEFQNSEAQKELALQKKIISQQQELRAESLVLNEEADQAAIDQLNVIEETKAQIHDDAIAADFLKTIDAGKARYDALSELSEMEVQLVIQEEARKKAEREAGLAFAQGVAQTFLNLAALTTNDQKQLQDLQKIAALVSVAINTGKAISDLTATVFSPLSPDNIATGGLAAYAKLAAGLAVITANAVQARQIINSFEGGGYTGHGNPKEVSTNLGSKSYTYHKDEYVIPSRVLNTPAGSSLAGTAESLRLGSKNPFPYLSGMFDGGFATRSVGASVIESANNNKTIQNIIATLPQPVVKVQEINKVQQSRDRAISVSSL